MDWIFILIAGAVIGWLASLIMKTDAQQGCILNIVIGVVGAALGRWIGDVLGMESSQAAGSFSVIGIVWGVLGAGILIAILKTFKVLR